MNVGLVSHSDAVLMSALGQKRTCAAQKVMSALTPKADMCGATRDVCFVPKADECTAIKCIGIRQSQDARCKYVCDRTDARQSKMYIFLVSAGVVKRL